ncbi:hypothetical protein [Natrarchaeobius chitinivorans]|nr:hypothetical protein [Natrarchaeobius chitinivorans]
MSQIPDQVMLDNDTLNYLQKDRDCLISFSETDADAYVSPFQYNEFTTGLDDISEELKDEILNQIHQLEEEIGPETTGVETSGYGEVYGYNYGGGTGEIYNELTEPHPQIGKVHRPDAVGAEVAINRDMPFITGDKALQAKMRHHGYDEYVIELDYFLELLQKKKE